MKIVGVTACPTGIAHTYMAAEALEQAGKKLNHQIKIETQGTKTENELTSEEIAAADLVILAIDKKIGMERFNGKKILKVASQEAIKDAESVIQNGLVGTGTYILGTGNTSKQPKEKKNIYDHLMTGVNFMLPFVIAGGILIAISFAFGITASDPKSNQYNILADAFNTVGGANAFALMVPVLAAGIAYSIAGKQGIAPGMVAGLMAKTDGSGFLGGIVGGLLAGYFTYFLVKHLKVRKSMEPIAHLIIIPVISVFVVGFAMFFVIGVPIKALLDILTSFLNGLGQTNGFLFGALIGAMMAFDMGGPINKSISTFSIGLMSTGVYGPIAACMVGGMVPPLGLALATVLFKNKFTEEERTSGKSCWILGVSYITEGAIPFAVSDPFRVIPSLMAGSAVGAAISLGIGCTSLAPHGGIWVMLIPNVIDHIAWYLVAIVAGTIVTALTVGLLKKKITV